MSEGVYVRMARDVERSIERAAAIPSPANVKNARADITQFTSTLLRRLEILEQASNERIRKPYRDD